MSDTSSPWKWTRRFGVGLTISVALFCAWGALAPHIPAAAEAAPMAAGLLMAAFYANAQGLANCMAANSRRAWAHGDNSAKKKPTKHAAKIEDVAMLGSTGTYVIGNDLNNLIVGNTGNDTLDGRLGADFMVGGAGDDIYEVRCVHPGAVEQRDGFDGEPIS